jgi:hypothetical protein
MALGHDTQETLVLTGQAWGSHAGAALAALGERSRTRSSNQLLQVFTSVASSALRAQLGGVFMIAPGTDVLSIQSCVGNRTAETARLQMRPGQGLAGLAFEADRTVKVDQYLEATEITPDFRPLARREAVRAALASPVRDVGGRTVGVLEVWRRNDAHFASADFELIDSLGQLASEILGYLDAFEGAARFVSELDVRLDTLRQRTAEQDRARMSQLGLLLTALSAGDLDRLVCELAKAAEGVVAAVDDKGATLAESGPLTSADRAVLDRAPRLLATGPSTLAPGIAGCRASIGERGSTVVLMHHGLPEEEGLTLVGWTALAAARIVAQETTERSVPARLDDLLWDLTGESAASPDRSWSTLRLTGTRRVLLVRGPDLALASLHGLISEAFGRSFATLRDGSLLALPLADRATPEAVSELLERAAPGPAGSVTAGLSSASRPEDLRNTRQEAEIALRVAKNTGARAVAYDELGLLRVLLPVGDGYAPAELAADLLGPLLVHDRQRNSDLLSTLRVYLESDCVIARAAKRLFVHPKTLRYRLSKIEALTGLDLSAQQGRFDAQLAIGILQASAVGKLSPRAGAAGSGS